MPMARIRGPRRASSATAARRHTAAEAAQRPDDVPIGQRIPAAVTTQLVSAAGTRRASSRAVAGRRGWLRHRPQTRTSGRSFSRRPGPMPSTSPSWSTLVNLPLASRQATIAAAVTGPTPGRVSNCCTVAVFRLTTAAGPPLAGPGLRVLVGPGAAEPEAHRTAQHRRLSFDRRDAHHDLLAVVDLAGHVEPDGVGAVRRAAGRLQRVGDPRARRQRDQARRVHQAHHADHDRLVRTGRRARARAAARRGRHVDRRQLRRHHRCGLFAHQREDGDQHRDRRDRGQRDGAGAARVGAHLGQPAVVAAPSRPEASAAASEFGSLSASPSSASRSGGAAASRLSAESSVQSLGGQFCSHAPTVGAPTLAATPSRALVAHPLWTGWRLCIND